MLDIENFEVKFKNVINSDSWKELESKFQKATNVFLLAHEPHQKRLITR